MNHTIEADTLTRFFKYNLWANTELFTLCATLTDEQLEMTSEGLPGGIRLIITHIVRGEGAYIRRASGEPPWKDTPAWDSLSITQTLPLAQLTGERLIALSQTADPAVRHEAEFDGKLYSYFNWTLLMQALYHGIEHRIQTKILLTQLGIEHPELAVWDYTDMILSSESNT